MNYFVLRAAMLWQQKFQLHATVRNFSEEQTVNLINWRHNRLPLPQPHPPHLANRPPCMYAN